MLAAVAALVMLFVLAEIAAAVLPLIIVMTLVPPEQRHELAEVLAACDSSRKIRLWTSLRAAVKARRTQHDRAARAASPHCAEKQHDRAARAASPHCTESGYLNPGRDHEQPFDPARASAAAAVNPPRRYHPDARRPPSPAGDQR
ncbi:MAG TPA: hypothetical protein VFR35_19420 [Actinoplanes sp.]|nr:hypothetical protein [Actinoplanes sp.]